jgi:CheY-like chemotaxis protein
LAVVLAGLNWGIIGETMSSAYHNTNGRTILVADDEETAHVLIHRAFHLAQSSCALQIVTNGEDAISYLQGKGVFANRERYPVPELVLLDLKMPKKDGFEVLKWMREQPGFKRMVTVMFSTSDEPRDINRSYDLGANSFLVKTPLFTEFTELIKSLDNYWLKHNRSAETS